MANLIEAAAELEYVPKDQLAQMINNPDAGYPSYLVLSEIQRRTQMEKIYNAERVAMEKPSTTVAEEVVANFTGGPQGLAGGPQGLAGVPPSSSEITSSGGMPALMAQGGRTGYQNTGKTKYRIIDDDSNIENLDRKNVGANPDMYGDYIAGAEKIRKSGLFDFGELPVMDTGTTDEYLEDLSGLQGEHQANIEAQREIPQEIQDFQLSEIDYEAPTEKDRQRELQVAALAGLAGVFGRARNLGEAGAGIGKLATNIQGIRKGQRKEAIDLAIAKRAGEAQDFGILTGKETLRMERNKAISASKKEMGNIMRTMAELSSARDIATYNAAWKKLEMDWEGTDKALTVTKDLIRDKILLEQVAATNNKTLQAQVGDLLQEKVDMPMPGLRTSAEDKRAREIDHEISQISKWLYQNILGIELPPTPLQQQ